MIAEPVSKYERDAPTSYSKGRDSFRIAACLSATALRIVSLTKKYSHAWYTNILTALTSLGKFLCNYGNPHSKFHSLIVQVNIHLSFGKLLRFVTHDFSS